MSVLLELLQSWSANGARDEPHAPGGLSRRVLCAAAVSCSVLVSYVIVSEQYAWGTVIGIALTFALLCFVKPQLALLIFLIYKPVENTLSRFGIDFYPMQAVNPETILALLMKAVNPETFLILLYAGIGLPSILIGARTVRFAGRQILPMLLLSGLMILSIAWNRHLGTDRIVSDLGEIKRSTFFFVGFILFMATPNKRRYLDLYLVVFFLVCAYLSLDLAWLHIDKAMLGNVESRVITFKESIVHTSPLVLGLGASILVALAVKENTSFFSQILCLSGVGLLVLSSFLLLSRALSGAVIVGVLATLLAARVWKRKLWVLLLVLSSLWLLLPEDLLARFGLTLSNVQLGADFTTQRLEVAWPDAVMTITEHPILGVGYGAYKQMAKLAPHNQLLDMWVHVGIGGVILFLWMFTSLVQVAWRARHDGDPRTRAIANGLFGQLIGCVVALMFNDSFFYPWLTYSLFFTAVLLEPIDGRPQGQRSGHGLRECSLPATRIG